jgi:Na+-driven multidrug efflux pump
MLPANQQSPQERVLHNYKKYFEHSEQDLEINPTAIFNYSPSFSFRAIPLI